MKPASAAAATAPPSTNPRASADTTKSTERERAYSASASTVKLRAGGCASSGVMSLKTIPGLGKSGMSRIWSSSRTVDR
jgi:hypothetical protein